MKVVNTDSVLTEGAAEACPTISFTSLSAAGSILRRTINFAVRNRTNILLICATVLAFAMPHLVRAEDLLSAQKQDAKDTFGHGSTVEWGLYIAEVIISVGAYMKTRNPMIFVGGLAFLIVITRTFFALAG